MIYEIPRHLGSFQELASLVRVSRRFYDILNPVLYKLDCKTGSPTALFWAAMIGNLRTLELSHAAGANLEQAWTSRRPL
ncbi:hypothetical protein B0H65DRAFT_412343, partial [Neurospora tetraspora]